MLSWSARVLPPYLERNMAGEEAQMTEGTSNVVQEKADGMGVGYDLTSSGPVQAVEMKSLKWQIKDLSKCTTPALFWMVAPLKKVTAVNQPTRWEAWVGGFWLSLSARQR